MIRIFFTFCSLLLCSFRTPNYCKLSDKIFFSYNKELCQRTNLHLTAKGGAMMQDVEKIISSYVSFEPMTVEQARRLYVEVIEGYLIRYNEDEKIRPYLHNYPFTIDNIKVTIAFEDETKNHRGRGYVALMGKGKGHRIYYCTYDPETEKFIDLHSEQYEDAYEIVLGHTPPECPKVHGFWIN